MDLLKIRLKGINFGTIFAKIKWNCVKFNFKNTVKIRVCTLKNIHEEKFIKFNCVKYFTRKMTGAIVTVQKDITT